MLAAQSISRGDGFFNFGYSMISVAMKQIFRNENSVAMATVAIEQTFRYHGNRCYGKNIPLPCQLLLWKKHSVAIATVVLLKLKFGAIRACNIVG